MVCKMEDVSVIRPSRQNVELPNNIRSHVSLFLGRDKCIEIVYTVVSVQSETLAVTFHDNRNYCLNTVS